MAPRKLSDSDKRQITSIYCQPGETTSTLAQKFGISSSTISRVLKQMLPDDAYGKLMKWKRSGERGSFPLKDSDIVEQLSEEENTSEAAVASTQDDAVQADDASEPASATDDASDAATAVSPLMTETEEDSAPDQQTTRRRSRRRSTARAENETVLSDDDDDDDDDASEPPAAAPATEKNGDTPPVSRTLIKRSQRDKAFSEDEDDNEVAAWATEGFDNDDDFDADSDEDWDDASWEEDGDDDAVEQLPVDREAELTILSFERFSLTKPCYLVVDRLAELITCPLKDFSELGMIPSGEEQARTLPVFDNHKIARRFARRNQRIIKVPDAAMLNKTQGYLQAKGITRILFDGRVYALN